MANINNKLFAYTYAKINDAKLLKQYENSLIFIGEEQQIYQPLTNTYIGIGKSAFTELENQINDVTDNKISEVVSYLNKTNTGKISAQYSEEQFDNLYGDNLGYLGTYSDNRYRTGEIYTTSNNVVLRGANKFTGLENLNDITISGLGNVFANSGINVSINRGSAHKSEYNPLDGSYSVTYYETSYITIDDTYTWSYIGSVNTYITNYAQKVAVDQANRVYKNLLGINDDVRIEKGFNEAFTFNTLTNELVTMDGGKVFVKVKGPNYGDGANQSLTDFTFKEVTINNTFGEMTIGEGNDKLVIFKRDTTTGQWKPWTEGEQGRPDFANTFSFVEGDGSMAYYNWDGDGGNINEYVPIFYQLDSSYTAYANINIADGINTIKEVAYILDLITDGTADDGINLTYNIVQNGKDIQELKEWQATIGESSVTSITAENNDSNLITLTQYSVDHKGTGESTGNVVIETKLNVAPVIANRKTGRTTTVEDPTTHEQVEVPVYRDYAVYDPDLLGPEEKFAYTYKWVYNPNYSNNDNIINQGDSDSSANITYTGGWFTKAAWGELQSHYLGANGKFIADGSDKVWVVRNPSNVPSTAADILPEEVDDAKISTIGQAPYIYIPWSLPKAISPKKDGVLDALTDVRWVTSYVNAAYEDLNKKIVDAGGDATGQIQRAFEERQNSYTAGAGQFISKVEQVNGYLTGVTYTNLPTDFLVGGSTITSYNVKYVKATGIEIFNNDLLAEKPIYDENLNPVADPSFDSNTVYYVKLNDPNGFTTVTSQNLAEINEKTIYVLDGNSYVPVSIQDAVAGGGISTDFSTVNANNTYFYASETAANDKYLEANSIHIPSDGSNQFRVNANITYVRNATASNTGLADAYDVRKTIEDMFTWIDLRTNAPFVAGA